MPAPLFSSALRTAMWVLPLPEVMLTATSPKSPVNAGIRAVIRSLIVFSSSMMCSFVLSGLIGVYFSFPNVFVISMICSQSALLISWLTSLHVPLPVRRQATRTVMFVSRKVLSCNGLAGVLFK